MYNFLYDFYLINAIESVMIVLPLKCQDHTEEI